MLKPSGASLRFCSQFWNLSSNYRSSVLFLWQKCNVAIVTWVLSSSALNRQQRNDRSLMQFWQCLSFRIRHPLSEDQGCIGFGHVERNKGWIYRIRMDSMWDISVCFFFKMIFTKFKKFCIIINVKSDAFVHFCYHDVILYFDISKVKISFNYAQSWLLIRGVNNFIYS